jgi:hypothetical protein
MSAVTLEAKRLVAAKEKKENLIYCELANEFSSHVLCLSVQQEMRA